MCHKNNQMDSNNLPIIITAMHGRPAITRAFCMAAARIKRETGVDTFSVVSRGDEDNIFLCQQYNIPYIEYRNSPIGAKWNMVLYAIKDIDYSHVIILGSDDIASTKTIQIQLDNLQYDMSGHGDLWLWGLDRKRGGFDTFGYWVSNTQPILGVGRMISKRMIDANDGKLWDDNLRMGLDRSSLDRVRSKTKNTHSYILKEKGGFVMDIKYGQNISSMSPQTKTMEFQDAFPTIKQHLSEEESQYLKYLHEDILHKS